MSRPYVLWNFDKVYNIKTMFLQQSLEIYGL